MIFALRLRIKACPGVLSTTGRLLRQSLLARCFDRSLASGCLLFRFSLRVAPRALPLPKIRRLYVSCPLQLLLCPGYLVGHDSLLLALGKTGYLRLRQSSRLGETTMLGRSEWEGRSLAR